MGLSADDYLHHHPPIAPYFYEIFFYINWQIVSEKIKRAVCIRLRVYGQNSIIAYCVSKSNGKPSEFVLRITQTNLITYRFLNFIRNSGIAFSLLRSRSHDFLWAKAEIAHKNPAFGRTRPSLREDLVQYDSRFSEEKQESMHLIPTACRRHLLFWRN